MAYPNVALFGTGSAFAKHYTTEEILCAFHKARAECQDVDYDADFADRIFRGCGFDEHSIALPPFQRMSRTAYLNKRMTTMVDMAVEAAEKAIKMWGGKRDEITHLYWGTGTGGIHSPSIDIVLAKRLGLSLDVERVNIEGMGCLTGYRLLNLGKLAAMDGRSRVLVVSGDLRSSLGCCLPEKVSRADIVAAALFRDGASAAVLGSMRHARSGEVALYEMLSSKSQIVADTSSMIDLREMDDGSIFCHVDKGLPQAVCDAEPAFVKSLLQKAFPHADPPDVPSISQFDVACHTGGPKILTEIASVLGAKTEQLASSWSAMKAHGNLDGASNLAVLDHVVRSNTNVGREHESRKFILCLAMGPGVCLEGAVLKKVHAIARHQHMEAPLKFGKQLSEPAPTLLEHRALAGRGKRR